MKRITSLEGKIIISFFLFFLFILTVVFYFFYKLSIITLTPLEIKKLTGILLLNYFLFLGFSYLVTQLLAQKILLPIHQLIKAMEKISYGSFSQRLDRNELEELDLVTISFNRMAEEVVIKNRMLEQKIKETFQLYDFNKVSNNAGNLEELAGLLTRSLNILQIEYGFIFMLRQETKKISEVFISGNLTSEDVEILQYEVLEKMGKKPLPKGRFFLIPSKKGEPKGFVCLPLYAQKQLVGIVGVDDGITRRTFNEGPQVSMFYDIATQLASFIERVKLYQTLGRKLEERKKELAALIEVGETANGTQDLDEILHTIVTIIVDVMGVGKCGIRLYNQEKNELVLKSHYGLSQKYVEKVKLVLPENNNIFNVVKTREPIIIEDITKEQSVEISEYLIKEGLKAAFSMPLLAKDKVLGTIVIYYTEPHYYTDEEKIIFTALANQAAIAIENFNLYDNLQQAYLETIRALVQAVEAKDAYTRGHAERVARYSVAIGEELNLDRDYLENIQVAAILHDIGKIGIPEKVLTKPGRLTEEEFMVMKGHPLRGQEILKPVKFAQEIIAGVYYHHERLDGLGYPSGLKGEQLPLIARILAVADAFDAMTSNRPYRSSLSYQYALEELVRCSGGQFDPLIVEAFRSSWAKKSGFLGEKHRQQEMESA